MINNINFLASKKKEVEERNKADQRSLIAIALFSAAIVLIFLVLRGINYYLDNRINDVIDQQDTIRQAILNNQHEEEEFLIFYEKVSKLTTLLQNRSIGTKVLVDSYQYFTTEDTAITSSIYDYYAHTFDFTLTANDVFALPELLALVTSEKFTSQFNKVELTSLYRGANGRYNLLVYLEI